MHRRPTNGSGSRATRRKKTIELRYAVQVLDWPIGVRCSLGAIFSDQLC